MEVIQSDSGPAICVVPVSSMRALPSHRSEIVSQLVFGEACQILENGLQDWCRIRCTYDGYEGWCQRAQLLMAEQQNSNDIPPDVLTLQWATKIIYNGVDMMIPFGSSMEAEAGDRREYINNINEWDPLNAEISEKNLRKIAFTFLNTSYLWGGKSVFGVDCSGFVQSVFKFFNIPLLRDASQQAGQGEGVGFLAECKCGDLAFFDNENGAITHVGMMLNDHEIIHASVKVRIDDMDNYGIVNRETGSRTHKLRVIKRYFEVQSSA